MQWLEWSDETFRESRSRGVPVLLYLHASWCRWCRELERTVLSDPRIEALIAERFVAVRVDKDRRPDIDARYSKGGWPTLAYLADTAEVIASDAYLEVDELAARLELVSSYYAENRDSIRTRLEEAIRTAETPPAAPRVLHGARVPGELSREVVDWVAQTLLETSDPVYGGWGSQHKFPHPEAIDFALIRWSQTGDESMRKLVVRTLRHMQQGEIHDRVGGGFYRYATAPDWSGPHHEKVLDSNAQRLFAYLEAYQALGEESFRETAQGVLRWMSEVLLDEGTGAFRGSQDADAVHARIATVAARAEHGAPECDPTIFTNWNAIAVSTLFKAASVLHEDRWREQALRTLDFLIEEMFDERSGMYHYWDGTYHLPGLLSDQAYTLRALIDAVQCAGGARYLELGQALAGLAIESLRSEGGGFFDTRHDPGARGGLRRRDRSILENSVMAEALLRLSLLTRDGDYADTARETLVSFLGDYKRYGHFVAGYARAVDLALNPPVHVTIVGPAERADTRALRAAALAPYVASRVVQVIDPAGQPGLLERCGLPAGNGGSRAYVQRGRESYAETADPVRLPAVMARLEHGG
jgi:uncharacterized protein YyaL (SSP411 family)